MMDGGVWFESLTRNAWRVGIAALVAFCPIVGAGGTALAAEKAPAKAAAPASGLTLYEHYCISCHGRGGGHPGTQNLAYLRGAEKAALADRSDLTPEYVRIMVRFGRGLMPGFRPSEISDEELKALAEFLAKGPHPEESFSKPGEAVIR